MSQQLALPGFRAPILRTRARAFRDTYPEHAHLFEIRERISARRAA